MSEVESAPAQQLIAELKVTAHLMTLDAGVYCVYAGADSPAPDPTTGLPAVRITVPPGLLGRNISLTSMRDDGWMGEPDAVSLIRVPRGPAQILITVYQLPDSPQEPPRLQVTRLVEGGRGSLSSQPQAIKVEPPPAPVAAVAPLAEPEAEEATVTGGTGVAVADPEIIAHVQIQGDVPAVLGEWVGEPGSQRWIEGFALAPRTDVTTEDIEYQAVLGRGWLSPWAEGGQYCGSRGMALPILGLRVRLRGEAAETHRVEVSATFTDGSKVGPVAEGEACESESLAPLEAFKVTVVLADAFPTPQEPAVVAAKPRPGQAAKPKTTLAPPKAAAAVPKPPAKPAPRKAR